MFPLVCIWYTHDFQQFYKLCLRKAQLDKLVCLMYGIIIQRWFTLYNSNVNLWFTLFSHICLHNPSYLFIYSRLLRYFVYFFVKKKKIHIYSCWDFGNHISYLEWLHRKYQGKRGELILNIAWWVLKWANEMISRKPKESTHDTLLMEQKVNLEFTRGFAESTRRRKRESTREIIWQKSVFIDNSLICFWWLQNI